MPNVTTPAAPYTLAEWETKPKNSANANEFEKYDYVTGETLASIAQRISQPGRTVTGDEIAVLNWGTAVASEINFYLRDHNGCKANSTDTAYDLASDDRQPWLWVPKVAPPAPVGKFRSPGKHDVGHVAPDHEPALHINTLVVPPVYSLTLELGDLDALFAPMDPRTDSAAPWTCVGVQQRLQALGYLYTPLGHSQINAHAKKCWQYYQMVHDRQYGTLVIYNEPVAGQTAAKLQVTRAALVLDITGGAQAGSLMFPLSDPDKNTLGALASAINARNQGWRAYARHRSAASSSNLAATPFVNAHGLPNQQTLTCSSLTNAQLLGMLKTEVQNNILARSFPKKGIVFQNSKLPPPGEFAAIRFPGGYSVTNPRLGLKEGDPNPVDADAEFDFATIQHSRWEIESKFWEKNDLLGKIPLIATVHRLLPNGTVKPAAGVCVYFQLAMPDNLPASGPFRAVEPELRDEAMDMSKEDRIGTPTATNPTGVTQYRSLWNNAANRPAVKTRNFECNPAEWQQAWQEAHNAHTQPNPQAYLNGLTVAEKIKKAARSMLSYAPPYETPGRGPRVFINNLLADAKQQAEAVDVDDPQKKNCPYVMQIGGQPKHCGGKAGLPVEGARREGAFQTGVFELTRRDGFHSRRGPLHRDYGDLPIAEKVQPDGDRHKYAVRAKTNEKGHAGVIFMPSRCGGDTYKLRAYIGPETLEFPTNADFSGGDRDGPVVETGTLVVWRNIRFYRWLRMQPAVPVVYSTRLNDLLRWPRLNGDGSTFQPGDAKFNEHRFDTPLAPIALGLDDAEATFPGPVATVSELKYSRPVPVNMISVAQNYRRGYCEFIIDADGPENMTQAELDAAFLKGKQFAQAANASPIPLDWDELVFVDVTSPFLLNYLDMRHYNSVIRAKGLSAATHPDLTEGAHAHPFNSAITYHIAAAMLDHFADGGVMPGLTLVQAPQGETWGNRALKSGAGSFTSGFAGARRAAFVFHTKGFHDNFMCYSPSANAAHELGHALAFAHQPPNPSSGDTEMHEPGRVDLNKPLPAGASICVMSYNGCYGEFCGRCLLALRGWRTKSSLKPDGA